MMMHGLLFLFLSAICLLAATSDAFAPRLSFGLSNHHSCQHTVCFAKHAQDKAAKWAASKRPKKSRLSDKNRAPIIYELTSMVKPPEYTISDAPATSTAKVVEA